MQRQKPLLFALCATLGALLAALIVEVLPRPVRASPLISSAVSVGLWSLIVAIIAVSLAVGQNAYLGRPLLRVDILIAALAGASCGFLSGLLPPDFAPLLGAALLGAAATAWIPNLGAMRGLIAGLIAGIIAVGAAWGLSLIDARVGRVGGVIVFGLAIGTALGFADVLAREFILEIEFAPGDIRRLTLGVEPVRVGANRSADIVLPDAVDLCYQIREGILTVTDSGTMTSLYQNTSRRVGSATLHVVFDGIASFPVAATSTVITSAIGLRLDIGGYLVELRLGPALTTADLPGLSPQQADCVAEVLHGEHASLLNLTREVWTVGPDAQRVEPGRSAPLVAGMRIDFGPYAAEVVT